MFEITRIVRTNVKLNNTKTVKEVDFDVQMDELMFRAFFFMIGNPQVGKILRVKITRDYLKCGLREAVGLVEEAQEYHEYEYRRLLPEDTHREEIDDFRNNHGQDD